MEGQAAPLIRSGLEWGGYTRQRHQRRGVFDGVRIHRNTVSALYREKHPGFTGTNLEASFRFYREHMDPPWSRYPYTLLVTDEPAGGPTIWQVHTLDTITPHAGGKTTHDPHPRGTNKHEIGIAIDHDCRHSAPSEALTAALAVALGTVLALNQDATVKAHRTKGPGACPGPLLPLDEVAALALQYARGTTPRTAERSGLVRRRGW